MNIPSLQSNICRTPTGRDALVLLIVGAALFLIASFTDAFEILVGFTRTYEEWEIDEFLTAVLLLSGGFTIFSLRRWNELKTEVQARKEIQERLKFAIEGGSLGVWDWNVATGKLSIIHDWIHDRTAPYPEETHVSIFEECVHPDDHLLLIQKMKEVRDDAMPYYEAECREQRQDGTWRWVHVIGKVTARDEEGRPVRATGITRDVTEVHRTREALEEANKKLDLLYSITRHDLLNQVSIIAAYTGLIEEETVENRRLREYTGHVTTATATIRDQIVFMQDYESMGVKAPEWLCVKEIARVAGAKASRGNLSIDVRTGQLEVFADPLFEKVIFNLVDNTIRHGEKATKVCISFHNENNEGILVIEDDGRGVPSGIKEHIFSRGFGREGSGLGLFLVREILGITGMTIQETGEEGAGARFEIVVPAGAFRADHR
ncbi:PAS domain S-box protein [Methanofollis formosanus]|uniref:histidine kinase n=1 Tax=Methanofollis formosanus TaxID=299308 RepID=A0A8G1A0N5_9EURY|nr:sensor histidine kinase [Methanofollis formosanus]QYZ78273.1 PAS domain S-box protein [Methanofollis formosanus]